MLPYIVLESIGAMETSQHGNRLKSLFVSVSFFFQELSEIPQKLKLISAVFTFDLFPFVWVRFLFVSFRFS